MAQQTRPLLADRDDDLGRYQPVSILAIAAIAVTGFFTAVVILLTVVGLVSRKPVLEPAVVLIDVIGIALALVARWQIRASEGTRAGWKLTKWALGLGILFGCVYEAYYYGNVLAIRQQASEFGRAWLALLEKKDFKQAFFFANPPAQQKGRDAIQFANLNPEGLVGFQSIEIIRILERAKETDIQVEPLGLYEWKETPDGLVVTLNYLLRTREGEFDVGLTAIGTASPDTGGRQWYIRANTIAVRGKRLTPYGRLVSDLHSEAFAFLQEWLTLKLNGSRPAETFADMQPLTPAERRTKAMAHFTRVNVLPQLAAATTPSIACAGCLAGSFFPDSYSTTALAEESKVNMRKIEFKDPPPSQRQITSEMKERIRARLFRPTVLELQMAVASPDVVHSRVDAAPDALHAWIPIDVMLPIENYRSRGQLYAVCTDAALVNTVNKLATDPFDKTKPVEFVAGPPLVTTLKHYWTIEKVVVELERNTQDIRPGGAMPMGPPR